MLSLRGTFILLMLFLSSLFGSIFMLAPFLPVMLLSTAWYRWITNRIIAVWLTLPVALIEMVLGVRVVITGDGFVPGERTVIIMNHRTRLDWMFLWSCLLRNSYLRMEKICLKSSLKSIPGFGWAMQMGAFIFIQRNWEQDQEHLSIMLDYLCDIKQPLQLLVFPEGTDLTTVTKARSDVFAESHGLPKYDYVLHPRTTGFSFIVERLRKGSNLDAIHDITVAYPYNIPQTERDLFTGNFPKEIHFHINRFSSAHLPSTVDGLQEWCRLRWHDKERLLRNFYQGGRSFGAPDQGQVQGQDQGQGQGRDQGQVQGQDQGQGQGRDQGQVQAQGEGQGQGRVQGQGQGRVQGQARSRVRVPPCKSRGRVFLIKCFSILYWTGFVGTMSVVIWHYTLARCYFASAVIFFVVQEKIFGGCELMEIAAHNRRPSRWWKKRQ